MSCSASTHHLSLSLLKRASSSASVAEFVWMWHPAAGKVPACVCRGHILHPGMHSQQADWCSVMHPMMQTPALQMLTALEKPHRASSGLGLCPESQFDWLLAWPQPAFVGRQTCTAMKACCLESAA